MTKAVGKHITKPIRWNWAQALLLSVPPLLLVAFGLWLYGTRPTELTVAEIRFKLLPKPLAHSALSLKNATRSAVAMQVVLFLQHPPGEKPVWWGSPVAAGFSDTPCFVSSGGQRRFISVYAFNKATYDTKRGQYRAVIEFIIPNTPAFTHQSTLAAAIDFWLDGRVVGSGTISTSVNPS